MKIEKLETNRVETGITFGKECYLDPSRAQEFLSQVNASMPNFFTRSNFQHLPKRFNLENFDGTKQCTVTPNRFNYTAHGHVDNEQFQRDVGELFACFTQLFALSDVRRIGKIYDFPLPNILTNDSLSNILKIEEHVEVNILQIVFRKEGKHINLHFLPRTQGIVKIAGGRINLEPEAMVRCDINNIDMDSPLNIQNTLEEVFEFADFYVQNDLVKFIDKYFGVSP